MELVWPAREYLPSYVAALEKGWSPDNVRGGITAREELNRIEADGDAFLATLVDRKGAGRPPHYLGHVGYGVVPWKRRRGYATQAPDNVPSMRVIEANGRAGNQPVDKQDRREFMRRIRYGVVMSLDGYIAGPKGEADWIIRDPAVDFDAMLSQFDTILVGRRTFELMARANRTSMPGMKTIVLSSTLQQQDYPGVTIIAEDVERQIGALRAESGKDIWLFGGGELFRRLLKLNLVDGVDVAVMPVLLGGGIPFLPPPAERSSLRLTDHHVYPTGIVSLKYSITRAG